MIQMAMKDSLFLLHILLPLAFEWSVFSGNSKTSHGILLLRSSTLYTTQCT